MGDVAGGGADGYYRRYTYEQLLSMVLADSIDDAEANRQQWRQLGRLLSDAATAADKVAKQIPEHYRSQHAAPAQLELLAKGGLEELARDKAADRIQTLTSEYINHANDILPPKLPGVGDPGYTGGDGPAGTGSTSDSGGVGGPGAGSGSRG